MKRILQTLLAFAIAVPLLAHSAVSQNSDGPYLALEPFVVNIKEGKRNRFMQVNVQVMASDRKVHEALNANLPAVRHAMIMLLAHQKLEEVRTSEGREALRQQALADLQAVVNQFLVIPGAVNSAADQSVADPAIAVPAQSVAGLVEAVYFTDFVVQ